MLSVNISDIAMISIRKVDYRCIIHNISKPKAINLLENYLHKTLFFTFIQDHQDRGYI